MLVEVDVVDLPEANETVSVPIEPGSRTCRSHATGKKSKFVDGRPEYHIKVADAVRADCLRDLIVDKATKRVYLILGVCTYNSDWIGATRPEADAPPVGVPSLVVEATPEEIDAHERGVLRELRMARSPKP